MRIACWLAVFAGQVVLWGIGMPSAAAAKDGSSRPLVLFVGDSITRGRPTGQPDYQPSSKASAANAGLMEGQYGYYEALVEATAGNDVGYRFFRLANGGQAITGWIGTTCRQVLQGRNSVLKEQPQILIVQDYVTARDDQHQVELEAALREMAQEAEKARVRLVWSTVVTDPRGNSGLKASDEKVQAMNDLLLRVAGELRVPVVRLDVAWARFGEFAREKTPVADWTLTRRANYADGVHPGNVGALLQALVYARDLGILTEQFDETLPEFGVDRTQAAEIKKLVYSWQEPPVIPVSGAPASAPK